MADLDPVFAALRPLLARHESVGVVLHDEPHRYYLGTHEVRAKDGYRFWLGGVETKTAHVSVHLIPVYDHPELLDDVSPDLRKRMQGKSCFNFKRLDPALFAELGTLIERGVDRYRASGKLTPPNG